MRDDFVFYGLLGFNLFLIGWNGYSVNVAGWVGWLAGGGAALLAVASIVLVRGRVQLAHAMGRGVGLREGLKACAEREQRERAARQDA